VDDRSAQAHSFGSAAHIYERGRPPYPDAALDWLLPAGGPRVLDLGAGTGKLTRGLVARGLDVIAVDPSAAMLAELRRMVPGVPTHLGTAEAVPLPDGAVDVVLMAQAWHWVEPKRAVPEIARVLSPGGRLGVLWNLRDDSSEWVRRLEEIIGGPDSDQHTEIGPPFGPVETHDVRWTHRLGPDALLDMVASRSRVILLPTVERAALLAQVRQLMVTHPGLVGRTEFELPLVTHCARARLPG
jgi:SAM-dependent methyltransferase